MLPRTSGQQSRYIARCSKVSRRLIRSNTLTSTNDRHHRSIPIIMTQIGFDSRHGILDGVMARRKINGLAYCKERVSGAVNLGRQGSRTMHILDELADLFSTTTTAAVLHHENATRTWIWIRERHLRRETWVNETKTTTRVIANAPRSL